MQKGKTNQIIQYKCIFAHILSKSKFAKPFPFYTTNCLRLLSTLIGDDGRQAVTVVVCLFICLHLICTDGSKNSSIAKYVSVFNMVSYPFQPKNDNDFQASNLEIHYVLCIVKKSNFKVRKSDIKGLKHRHTQYIYTNV